MAHPSIEKARELLARLDQQEVEYEVWREQHRDELIDHELATLARQREQGLVCKSNDDNGFDPQQAIADIEWQQRHQPRDGLVHKTHNPQPQLQRVATVKQVRHLAETIGSRMGKELRKVDETTATLRDEIAELRGELNLLRAMVRGEVKQIKSGDRNVA